MKLLGIKAKLAQSILLLTLTVSFASFAADQKTFSSPEAAVDALTLALKAKDSNALISIFGEKYKDLIITGAESEDIARQAESAEKISTFHALHENDDGSRTLIIGAEAWPMPIPIIRENGIWRFASEQGVEELINRRIGRNELNAIKVLQAYIDAQRQYASIDRNGDGVLEFAKKIGSSLGKQDGLYWPADETKGETLSPFGPLLAESSLNLKNKKNGEPYQGYHFKILTAQGKSASGGAYSYVINGRMLAGFAMLAYPSSYGTSGIMSVIVNHNGKIYEKNLGKNTKTVASNITRFNPVKGWVEVNP